MFKEPEFQASARLDKDGEIAVKATAIVGYGERSASATTDVQLDEKDEAKLKSILSKAARNATVEVSVRTGEDDEEGKPIREIKEIPLGQKAYNDAAEALVTATRNGEQV